MDNPSFYKQVLDGSLFVTGAPRSGTTLLGKLVATLEKVEYFFEPPTFYRFCTQVGSGKNKIEEIRNLVETYLVEDLLLEAVQGRGLNIRPMDDSQVFNRIDWPDLNQRWQTIPNRAVAIQKTLNNNIKIAIKTPNAFDAIALIESCASNSHILVIKRNGVNVVESIVAKGWLEDKALETELWPYRDRVNGVNVPYWVPERYIDRWSNLTSLARSAMMWTIHAKQGLEVQSTRQLKVISYEKMCANPRECVKLVENATNKKSSIYTERWISTVRKPGKIITSNQLFEKLDDEDSTIARNFKEVNRGWGYE